MSQILINKRFLDAVSKQATQNPRLRMNYNFHKSLYANAQRLLNALEPGTIVPIHRHQHTDETYILLRGRLKVVFYNENKELTDSFLLDPMAGDLGIHIPAGQWHTVEVLEEGTVIFEVKDGPYMLMKEEDILQ